MKLGIKEKPMRSMWKGSISFGLVNIPVSMYTGSQAKEISFTMLHKKDNSPIRYAKICKDEEKEVPWNEIVKAYEYQPGDFVIMDDEDFQKANLQKTKTIEIVNFVDEEEVDSVYFVKPYYLEPDKNAGNAYSLLRESLKKSKKVGLARYVLRNHEHLAILKVYDNALVLIELRYETELVNVEDLKIPEKSKLSGKEVEIAIKLIDHLTVPFEPHKYQDSYEKEIKQIIKQKAKGKPIHPKSKEPVPTKIHDIMSLLQASLDENKKPKRKTKKSA